MRSRQASLLVQRILHLRQVQSQLQSAPLVLRRGLAASSGDDDNDSKPGLMQKIWGLSRKAEKAGKEVAAAEASAASDAADGSDGSSTVPEAGASDSSNSERALVLSGPERKHHKVFVVELTRKPLFPGIYTPVTISKNEKLIKEIMDTKKQGAQAYVGAFLRKPDTPPASTAATAATASG
ncbi:Lon protease homolog, partial [Haematococcus lacustris]